MSDHSERDDVPVDINLKLFGVVAGRIAESE
jgi:hypothetical protein